MLENINNENLEDIKRVFNSLTIPKKISNLDAKNYVDSFKNNNHFEILQFCSLQEYDQLISNLIEYYPNEKAYLLKVILESFYPYISENSYIRYIKFLHDVKDDFPDYVNEFTVLSNFIIDSFTYYFNSKLSHLKVSVNEANIVNLNSKFNMNALYFYFDFFTGESKNVIKNLDNAIHNNSELNCNSFGDHMFYITVLGYYISRNVVYKKLDYEIIDYTLEELRKIKNQYFNMIKKGDCFIPAFVRISSLVSCYYNVLIKYKIENIGKNNIKQYVDEYFDDMIFLYESIMNFLIIGEKKKFLLNFIELISFYNMINVDMKNVGNSNIDFKSFYMRLIHEAIYEMNFINMNVTKYTRKFYFYKNDNIGNYHTLSELGMFISGISLFDKDDRYDIQHRFFAQTFAEFFSKYKIQNYEDPFAKIIKPVANTDYIWRN